MRLRKVVTLLHATVSGARRTYLRAFRTVYGRGPSAEERRMLRHLWRNHSRSADVLRAVITHFDQYTLRPGLLKRFSRGDLVAVPAGDFEMLVDRLDPSVSAEIRARDGFEPHLTRFFREQVRPGATVVDVGANVGYFSLLASRLVGPTGKVFAFEPNSENCRLVLLNLAHNEVTNVTLYPVGLGAQRGHAYFSPALGSNGGVIPGDDALASPGCTVIPMMRLDDMIDERIDLIKMDVEGAEGLVVAGARKLLERHRPIVTAELSPMLRPVSAMTGRAFIDRFLALGYRPHLICRQGQGLLPIDVDRFLESLGPTQIEDLAFLP